MNQANRVEKDVRRKGRASLSAKIYPFVFCSLVVLGVLSRASVVHAQDVQGRPEPVGILHGDPVGECAWPAVVELRNFDNLCTAVYVGDRVILTARHCLSASSFLVPSRGWCESPADCPDLEEYGFIDLECNSPYGDPTLQCTTADPQFSNPYEYAYFGQRYDQKTEDFRKAVPILYFRKHPTTDIGYCLLSEIPNVQPLYPMMPCEAQAVLHGGTPVAAIGFGQSVTDAKESATTEEVIGTKLIAWSTFDNEPCGADCATTTRFLSWTEWTPGRPQRGDSGGPLVVEIPGQGWRVAGIASTGFPEYLTPWRYLRWLAEDPNVDMSRILPCHTVDGAWSPGPNCGEFPLNPGQPSGSWGRGPMACYQPEVSGPGHSCGAGLARGEPDGFADPTPSPPVSEAPAAEPGAEAESASSGCTAGTRPADGRWLGVSALLALPLVRRRSGGAR